MYSGLKGCREAKNAQPKPHFYQAAPPTCAPPHPAMPGAKKKNPLRNNNKTAATAGVGRVQLNFQTAGRDQRWKSIFCSNTRPASIIQRRVPLGDLSLSPSPALFHADSLWLARPQQQTLPLPRLLRCSWRFQDFFYFSFFSQVWHLKCLKCLACRSHTLPVFFSMHLSWLGGAGGDNLADMLKSPHVVRVAIYLPRATHPDPSPPPPPPRPPSFCLYPSSKSCTCQERCSCHLPLFPLPLSLILFAFPAVHKATLNMPKWGWKCTHSLLFTSSSHRNSLPSSNPLHRHFLALPSPHSILSSHPTPALLQSPVILSLSSAVSVASIHPPLRLPHIGHRARCHWMLQAGFGKQGGGLTPGEEAWAGRKPQETRVEGEGASCGKGGSVWVNAITVTEKWECIYWIFMQTVLPSSHGAQPSFFWMVYPHSPTK